jgi:hypothetical protein
VQSGPPPSGCPTAVSSHRGAIADTRRRRRPPPPRGWWLAEVAAGLAELDSFDLIEDLKIQDGPLVSVLTATSLHGGYVQAWPEQTIGAREIVSWLIGHWRQIGLPAYAQFDNDTRFQGVHHFADAIGRVSRLCLSLGVTPVFAPPREPGFQNAIESFNGLWQAKVWQRFRYANLRELKAQSVRYVQAHLQRSSPRRTNAPPRVAPFPSAGSSTSKPRRAARSSTCAGPTMQVTWNCLDIALRSARSGRAVWSGARSISMRLASTATALAAAIRTRTPCWFNCHTAASTNHSGPDHERWTIAEHLPREREIAVGRLLSIAPLRVRKLPAHRG